jgi:hypothetical protein
MGKEKGWRERIKEKAAQKEKRRFPKAGRSICAGL